MHIVMVEPEIPGNTGNVARLCAANHITLHLVKPLGFSIDDKHLKRAGLDYWSLVDVQIHENFQEVLDKYKDHRFFYLTTKSEQCYADIQFQYDDMLVFGKETKGLPEDLLKANPERCFRVPMVEQARSLNLSNTVAIVSYEAIMKRCASSVSRAWPRAASVSRIFSITEMMRCRTWKFMIKPMS